jgi:hypothetical protein
MHRVKRAHLVIGILLFIAFCVTGKLMRIDFPDKDVIPQDLRLLMRSRHIYILFASLMHLLLGIYLRIENDKMIKPLQYAGSFILIVSGVVLIFGWWTETYQLQHFSDVSRQGIYAALAGVGLHLIAGLSRVVSSRR